MSQNRTDQRTQTPHMQMREDDMPAGQAPARMAPQRPLTAMERSARDREGQRQAFYDSAIANQVRIEQALKHHGISFDFFMAALDVGLRNTMKNDSSFFEKVSAQAFLEALLRSVHFGLLPDGKEGAIVRFAEDAAFLPMVEGFIKIIWATGMVTEINHNVVCEGDDFEFEEGDSGFVRHRRSLKRKGDAEVIGAWCVIKLKTGGKLIEICDQDDLMRIAKVSRAQKGPRADWAKEMHRKGPFRRIIKRLPKTKELTEIIAHDDGAYDLARASTVVVTPAIPNTALFADERHQSAPASTQEQDLPAEEQRESEDTDARQPRAEQEIVAELRADAESAHDLEDLARRQMVIEGSDDFKGLADTTKEGFRRLFAQIAQKLAAPAEDTDVGGYRGLTSSTQKEPKVYADAKEWADAMLAKMGSCNAEQLAAFWMKNEAFVFEAMATAKPQAARLIHTAAERGIKINQEGDNAEQS